MTEAPPGRVKPPGKRASIVLAVLMHVLLAALLIYGIRWQTKVQNVVEVDLVRQAPEAAPPPPPQPEVQPEPKPAPKPEPKPEPKAEPKPPPKPDIAIKEKPKAKEPPKPKFDPFRDQLAQEEKQRKEEAFKNMLADEQRQERQKRDAQQAAQASAARDKALASYTDRIRAKIKGNIVMPPDLRGNPSAVFDVVQLPSGEVITARLAKSSGNAAYDDAVERAIRKASPLPRPDDPGLFQRNLRLTFCPVEGSNCI